MINHLKTNIKLIFYTKKKPKSFLIKGTIKNAFFPRFQF